METVSLCFGENCLHPPVNIAKTSLQVTQTATGQGQFEAKFYHLIFEEEFARVKGHFGPINTLAFHPDGNSYASGGEDGYVRLQAFDKEYFSFDFDY